MDDRLTTQAHQIAESLDYITIASVCPDGTPWNTPVYAVKDAKFNFYWRSWIHSQHSQNIRHNPNIFIVIYDSTRPSGTNHQQCLYIKAEAQEINDREKLDYANSLFPKSRQEALENFSGKSNRRFYQAIPEKIWLNNLSERDVTDQTKSMRVEVPLAELIQKNN